MSTDPYDLRGLRAQADAAPERDNVAPDLTKEDRTKVASFDGPGQTLSPEELDAILRARETARGTGDGIAADRKNR